MADNKSANDLIKTMEGFFAKAPALPTQAKEILVKIAPWIALIFGILGVIAGVGAIGISPLALLSGLGNSLTVLLSGVLTLISSVLMLLAYPKLRALKMEGWKLLFWSEVAGVASSLIALAIGGAIIGGFIGFYLLFQIKSYYK